MSRERHLIVGLAKTGTTAVAVTIRNALPIPDFLMEPKDFAEIDRAAAIHRVVVKIVFDHWVNRANELRALVRGEIAGYAPVTVVLVRDPRDEAISRLHYLAYEYFSTRATTLEDRSAWIDIFRRKEAAPESIGFIDMRDEILHRFGLGFLPSKSLYEAYCGFVDGVVDTLPVRILRYEDFINRSIANQPLRVLLSGSRDVGDTFRRVQRSMSSGAWPDYLTDRDLGVMNPNCEPMLHRFGYPLERTRPMGKPSRAHGSDYVERLIDEARALYERIERAKG